MMALRLRGRVQQTMLRRRDVSTRTVVLRRLPGGRLLLRTTSALSDRTCGRARWDSASVDTPRHRGDQTMSAITTHVLDTARGRPGGGCVSRSRCPTRRRLAAIGSGETDADGRLRTLMPEDAIARARRLSA